MSRREDEVPAAGAANRAGESTGTAPGSTQALTGRPRSGPDRRVALDLRADSDAPLQERPLDDDPREAEHQRRLEEQQQEHQQAMELLRLKNGLALKRENTPSELIKARAQAILAVGMATLALGTLCYLLIRSDTPLDLKKDILKYVGGAIGGIGVGYALGKRTKGSDEE
jgi:hypothetical protein